MSHEMTRDSYYGGGTYEARKRAYRREQWAARAWVAGAGLTIGALIASLVIGIMALSGHDTHVQCKRLAESTGLPTRTVGTYNPGCYVKVGGQWMPEDKWINNHPVQ